MNKFELALITGASSGLGKALAHQLANLHIPLILTGRDQRKLTDLAALLSQKTPVNTLACDFADPKERSRLIELIQESIPDLVINNAGFGLYGDILTHPTSSQMEILEVDGLAVMQISIEAARALKAKKKPGTIVNVSSAAAFFPYPTFAAYASSKSFVNQFSQAFDAELKPHNIRILTTCPGQIATQFRKRASLGHPQKSSKLAMSPQKAASYILEQIRTGKSLYIFDWRTRFAVYFSRLIPKKLLIAYLKKSLSNRVKN